MPGLINTEPAAVYKNGPFKKNKNVLVRGIKSAL